MFVGVVGEITFGSVQIHKGLKLVFTNLNFIRIIIKNAYDIKHINITTTAVSRIIIKYNLLRQY